MKKNIKLLTFLTDYDINNESLNEYLEITQLERMDLLNKTFKLLNKSIFDLSFSVNVEDLLLIEKTIQLIDLVCSNMSFTPDDIMTLKKRIKKSRESLLIHAKNDDNPDLIQLANKLDEIVLDKSFKKEDLIFLVKELINRKEDPNIIKRFLNINKDAIISNLLLFDYTFYKVLDSLNNNNENIFYYITLLKLFYTSRVKKHKYIVLLQDYLDNPYVDEILSLLNGIKRSLTPEEIMDKYDVISSLPQSSIVIPKITKTNDSIITIDDNITNLRDDGLSIQRDGNKYIVKVNIADAGAFIYPGSIEDINARINYRNIHLTTPVKMLPFDLRRDLSLNQGQNRQVITMCVVMNDSGDIEDYYLEKNEVQIARNITYNECDKIIGRTTNKFNKNLSDLFYLASALEAKNAGKQVYWTKKENSKPDVVMSSSKGFKIIREFMVLYNMLLGQFAFDRNIPYVYRYQDSEYMSTFLKQNGIKENEQIRSVIDSIYLDSKFSTSPRYHEGIKTQIYTQSTDPLRKYPDLYNQQLLHKFYFGDLDFPFDYEDFRHDVDYFNQRNADLALMRAEYVRGMRLTKNN